MPSPFPGMDPYLESRRLWPVFHKAFITALMFELNEFLPEGFVASQDERVYLAPVDREIQPDTAVFRTARATPQALTAEGTEAGRGVAVEDLPVVLEATLEEEHEPFIEVLTADQPQQVVAVIEVLSPKNKYRTARGWEEYHRKQRDVLRGDAHLIEIDLLRGGNHSVAVARERLEEYEPFDYLVALHRAGTGDRFEAWPLSVRERLPRIRLPLTAEYADLIFDLQTPFERAYEGGRFGRRIDYTKEPTPRLSREERAWAHARLSAAGLR